MRRRRGLSSRRRGGRRSSRGRRSRLLRIGYRM